MKNKDGAILKVLADIKYTPVPTLTQEQEDVLRRAFDPEEAFLYNVKRLFTQSTIVEDVWDDDDEDERKRSTPNPLPVADEATFRHVTDWADEFDENTIANYKKQGHKLNGLSGIGEIYKRGRAEGGSIQSVPISKIVASEKFLDGEHLRALVYDKPTTPIVGTVWAVKFKDRYYLQDGNHRAAAEAFKGSANMKMLVLDMGRK